MKTTPTWQGYTLQELRLRRIVTETKIEILKAKVFNDSNDLKKNSVPAPFASPIFKKLMGALDYADYMVMAFSIGRKVVKLLKRKKR